VNAKLQDVTQAIARESGCQVSAPGDDVRVSLYLRNLQPEELLCAIASGCGLCAREVRGGSWVFAEAMGTSAGYGASVSRRVYLNYLRATEAIDLLPNFLLDYVRADETSNCLVVNGPDYLADRVVEDIGKLDVPAPEVEVEVIAVEFTSGYDLARALRLEWSGEELAMGVDTLTGDLSFLWLEGLEEGWEARLNWLEADTSTHLKMRMTTRMLNGHQGFVAAGEELFVVLERVYDTYKEAFLQSISTGSFVTVQPLVGSGNEVLLSLGVVVRSLRGTDPRSGLPIVSLRRANSALRVRDGETVLLAGIEAKDWSPGEREIPVLSSTPVVGGVFRAPERSQSETRLAFFVTPRIIRGVDPEEGGDDHHG
jgi:type II secretory pathway component GspD/PulD (secretin)